MTIMAPALNLKVSSSNAQVSGGSVKITSFIANAASFVLPISNPANLVIYGSKMPVLKMSKRWTFIVGPDLKIREIKKDVDPVLDSERTADEIKNLKSKL